MSGKRDTNSNLVDVIIPVYNAEKYILETLNSIAAQSYSNFRAYVVDDCSTDHSSDIIRSYCGNDARFIYVRTLQNFGGPAGPRNTGISLGNSDWVAFCDSDDIWMPHKLALQMQIAADEKFDLLCGGIVDFADGSQVNETPAPTIDVKVRLVRHPRLLLKNWIAMSTVIVRRDALDMAGTFNESKNYVAVEDFDMWLRLSGRGCRLARVSFPLVHYRKVATSISANKNLMIKKALNVIGQDYDRRGRKRLFSLIRPVHWLLYVTTSGWMRAVRRTL